jgi:hypothetical protein
VKLRPLSDPRYEALFGPVGASQWIGAVEWAIRRLKELGVPPPANSRLGRAPELMRTLNADPQRLAKATPQRRLLAEAQRTALEFIGITRSINPRAGSLPNVLRRKLARAYGGADDPADDTDRTFVARNTQFELWIAAWLTAGKKLVRICEPDLQVAQWFQWRGIAVKRIRSQAQILKRVKEAAAQVKEHTATGFVALALDNYSVRRRIRTRTDLEVGSRFFASYPEIDQANAYLAASAPWVRGLVCFGHHARWLPDRGRPSLQMSNLVQIYQLPTDEAEADQLNAFFEEQRTAFTEAWRKF